ncbi:hypothetical protein G1K37_11920 [Tenacibaculum dicentrarchi]|nr:hypothetical protein [Tenacibaculum dicentrarchi]
MNINLEREIKKASERITDKQASIKKEISNLEKNIKLYSGWGWTFVWLGLIFSIFSVWYFLHTNIEKGFALNLLGDFLGGSVASLWSLAGLFFIYVAFLGQKQQLLNQQLELMYSQLEVKYTRLELSGQKEELKKQNDTLKQQKFENTFFQLITLFNSIVNSLDLRNNETDVIISTGRDCFELFYKKLRQYTQNENRTIYREEKKYNLDIKSEDYQMPKTPIGRTIKAYDNIYKIDKSDLSHYFRTIYHIFKFIENSDITNKKQYTSIARAQLSSYEQILIFYNCLHSNGIEKFKPLIEKHSIFKNIDESLIINQNDLKEYGKEAYGK